jgi:hypothetical protein
MTSSQDTVRNTLNDIKSRDALRPLKQALYSSRIADKFVVRLPDGMRERIAEVSKGNHRSMNSEIIARLERTLKEDGVGDESDDTIAEKLLDANQMADLLDRSLASRIFQLENELAAAHAELAKLKG